jgi:hypothetical protein
MRAQRGSAGVKSTRRLLARVEVVAVEFDEQPQSSSNASQSLIPAASRTRR